MPALCQASLSGETPGEQEGWLQGAKGCCSWKAWRVDRWEAVEVISHSFVQAAKFPISHTVGNTKKLLSDFMVELLL